MGEVVKLDNYRTYYNYKCNCGSIAFKFEYSKSFGIEPICLYCGAVQALDDMLNKI